MNGYMLIAADEALRLANDRTDAYRREKAIDRLAPAQPKRSPFGAIASTVSSFRAAISTVETDLSLPALDDYPYRS